MLVNFPSDVIPGLANIGNSCFLNALVQSLASCPLFMTWLSSRHTQVAPPLLDTLHSLLKGSACHAISILLLELLEIFFLELISICIYVVDIMQIHLDLRLKKNRETGGVALQVLKYRIHFYSSRHLITVGMQAVLYFRY